MADTETDATDDMAKNVASSHKSDDEECAENAMRTIRTKAARALREEFPYLKEEAMSKILDKSSEVMQHMLKDQFPVMAATKERISFMSLSAELRNNIYELVMGPQGIELAVSCHVGPSWDRSLKPKSQSPRSKLIPPTITQVNRQIRAETLSIFYGANIFHLVMVGWTNSSAISAKGLDWLGMIGPTAARMITNLHLQVREIGLRDHVHRPQTGGTIKRRDCLKKLGFFGYGIQEKGCKVIKILEHGDEDDDEV